MNPFHQSDPTAYAKAIAKGIDDFERNAEVSLKETYNDQANNVLKALRRALPVTKQKMGKLQRILND